MGPSLLSVGGIKRHLRVLMAPFHAHPLHLLCYNIPHPREGIG